jgi:hypothetical protein
VRVVGKALELPDVDGGEGTGGGGDGGASGGRKVGKIGKSGSLVTSVRLRRGLPHFLGVTGLGAVLYSSPFFVFFLFFGVEGWGPAFVVFLLGRLTSYCCTTVNISLGSRSMP